MKRILLIDESLRDRLTLAEILGTKPDWRLLEANSGDAAITHLRELNPPDLCIVGTNVGGESGAAFLVRLRNGDGGIDLPHIPILLCAPTADRARLAAELKLDAASFLLKPYNAKKVTATVERVLALG